MIATVSFGTTQSNGLTKVFDSLLKVGRYPLEIFGDFLKVILIYFLPLVLIAQLPSQALLERLSPGSLFFALGATSIFLALSLFLWRVGLKNYLSAIT